MGWYETEIKYLAGLLDADGCLTLWNNGGYVALRLNLDAAESIDKDGRYLKSLSCKAGRLQTRNRDENWATQNTWILGNRADLEMFLPRVVKHMVVKGKHWKRLYDVWVAYRGENISDKEFEVLKEFSVESRLDSGPIKHKNHPSWAWVAGFIDGDGWYMKRERKHQIEMQVGAVCHPDDVVSLELLHKAFGGVLKEDRGHMRWIRNLGPRDSSFAIKFLRKMVQHSNLKKWKIEQILHIHLQRLSDSSPKGRAIV